MQSDDVDEYMLNDVVHNARLMAPGCISSIEREVVFGDDENDGGNDALHVNVEGVVSLEVLSY
jgi:hypothetical protein